MTLAKYHNLALDDIAVPTFGSPSRKTTAPIEAGDAISQGEKSVQPGNAPIRTALAATSLTDKSAMPPRCSNRNANDRHDPPKNDVVTEAILQEFQILVNLIAGGNGGPLHQNQNNGPNGGIKTADVEKFKKLVPAFRGEPDPEKYFPHNVNDQKEEEFVKLVHNVMIVEQYEAKFTSSSRYAQHLVDTKNRKARRFKKGLKHGIKNRLLALKLPTYAKVVERAKILETDYKDFRKE
ncbi:hypothetical protein RJ639_004824 [Escallonia herrerae]|uniref:Retrotransposon gag domain-containing protein n=1 Tax=Escallonia herrerae TaxID=1293975 RepID=A0AA89AWP9_9ASTE|nr:hypothetical protein RJ639_004824 [Escallonia herrerae]